MTKLILIPISFLFSVFIFGQKNIKVDYEMVKTLDNNALPNLPEEVKVKLIAELSKPEHHILYLGKSNSFYTNVSSDEVTLNKNKSKAENNTKTVSTKFKNAAIKYYKSNDNDSIYIYHQSKDEEFYEIKVPKWQEINYFAGTTTIDKFECKLAEVTLSDKSIVKVWFTERIPFSAGPLVFSGFPGLVLKVETPTYVIYATKISDDIIDSDIKNRDPKLKAYKGQMLVDKMKEVEIKRTTPTETQKTIRL